MIPPGRFKKHPVWRLREEEACPDCLWIDACGHGPREHRFARETSRQKTRRAVKAAAVTLRSRWWAERIVAICNNPYGGGGAYSAICEARRYQGDGESEAGRCWPPRHIPVFEEGRLWG